jgi:hypothetical protein
MSRLKVIAKCPEYPVLRGFYGWEEVLSRLNPAEPVDNWRVMSPTATRTKPIEFAYRSCFSFHLVSN